MPCNPCETAGGIACKGNSGKAIMNGESVKWRICECHQLTAPTYLYSRETEGPPETSYVCAVERAGSGL